mmetsp:Transcript_48085/g.97905  ORF Transcript_48085/g.97905 Transcript_48085/m.97905 type:complete len:203 (+) Transcript_48085:274-882(+)
MSVIVASQHTAQRLCDHPLARIAMEMSAQKNVPVTSHAGMAWCLARHWGRSIGCWSGEGESDWMMDSVSRASHHFPVARTACLSMDQTLCTSAGVSVRCSRGLGLGLDWICRQKEVAVHGRCNAANQADRTGLERRHLQQPTRKRCLETCMHQHQHLLVDGSACLVHTLAVRLIALAVSLDHLHARNVVRFGRDGADTAKRP